MIIIDNLFGVSEERGERQTRGTAPVIKRKGVPLRNSQYGLRVPLGSIPHAIVAAYRTVFASCQVIPSKFVPQSHSQIYCY